MDLKRERVPAALAEMVNIAALPIIEIPDLGPSQIDGPAKSPSSSRARLSAGLGYGWNPDAFDRDGN